MFYKLTKKLPNQWVDLPVGDICEDPAPNKLQEFSVKVTYQQWDRNLCMIKSLVSALTYIGLKNESKVIDKKCDSYDGLPVNSSCFLLKQHMRENVPIIGTCIHYGKKWRSESGNRARRKNKTMTITTLLEEMTIYPTVVVPKGFDNGVGHAVCVVDDLILIPHRNIP